MKKRIKTKMYLRLPSASSRTSSLSLSLSLSEFDIITGALSRIQFSLDSEIPVSPGSGLLVSPRKTVEECVGWHYSQTPDNTRKGCTLGVSRVHSARRHWHCVDAGQGAGHLCVNHSVVLRMDSVSVCRVLWPEPGMHISAL